MRIFTYFLGNVDKFIVPLDGFDQTLDIKNAYYRPDYYFQNNYIDNGSIFFALESDNSYLNNVSNIQNNTELECDTNGCSAILSTGEVSPDRNTGIGIYLTIPKYTGSKRLIKFSYNGIHVFSVMQVQENHFYCYIPTLTYNHSGDNTINAIMYKDARKYSLFIVLDGAGNIPPLNTGGIVSLQNPEISLNYVINNVLPTVDYSGTLKLGYNLYNFMNYQIDDSALPIPKVDRSLSDKFIVPMTYYYINEYNYELLAPADQRRRFTFSLYALDNLANKCYLIGRLYQNLVNHQQELIEYSYITSGNFDK